MSTLCNADESTLIIIDLQERLMPVIHDSAAVIRNALMLAKGAKLLNIPVIGTAQNPQGLGENVAEIHTLCDKVITKTHFDACNTSSFLSGLDPRRNDLIVVGCEAHVCVLQSVLGLLQNKMRVRLIADAIGSRQPFNKAMALDRAHRAGADILTAEMVMFEWMRTSDHPHFKSMLKPLK